MTAPLANVSPTGVVDADPYPWPYDGPIDPARTALAFDVARVEWARVLAFDEPSRKVVAPEKLARTAPDRLKLALQPYIILLELSHPVDDFMRRLKRAEFSAVSNAVSAGAKHRRRTVTVRRSRTPVFLAVHRLDNSVYFKRHDREAHALLLALRDGATLGAACETAIGTNSWSAMNCVASSRKSELSYSDPTDATRV